MLAYKSGFIKATENFKLGVVAAILEFFGIHMSFIHSSGPMGIAFSAFVVVIAALNLVLDFDFIEKLPANRIFPAIWSGTELLGLLSHLFGFILRSCAFWRNGEVEDKEIGIFTKSAEDPDNTHRISRREPDIVFFINLSNRKSYQYFLSHGNLV